MSAPAILAIGGLDSSAGAGLLRDQATALALGMTCRVAATAVTAQGPQGVTALAPVGPGLIGAQIAAGLPAGAIKIGMLANRRTIDAVLAALPAPGPKAPPIVLDPVLAASSGRALLSPAGRAALIAALLPRVAVLTPNRPELAWFARALGLPPAPPEAQVAQALLDLGAGAVLVKGGHARPDFPKPGPGPGAEGADTVTDRLYRPGLAVLGRSGPRHALALRGTGCQFATALAIGLARGQDLPAALDLARASIAARFSAALRAAKALPTDAKTA